MDEHKYTAVIPTLWKSERIFKLIEDLQNCDKIHQIIIIDNGHKYFNYYKMDSPKLQGLIPKQNIYVNPSWNVGVAFSQTQNIVILGDDANFDTNIFSLITTDVLEQFGIIGMDSSCYHNPTEEMFIRKWEGGARPWGWGCVMFLQKKNWINIPPDMLVWYGDDYIMHVNKTPKAILHNFPIQTEMSTTSDRPEFDEIKRKDKEAYEKHLRGFYDKTTN